MERAEVVRGFGEMLAAACFQFCLQKANVIWTFFFLLLTLEDFARGSSCWVHSGKQNREKNAKNQKYQKQETKQWLKLESSEAGMDFSPTEAAEGTPQVRSPIRPEAFTFPAGPSVPLESSSRDLQPSEEVELPWKEQGAGGRRVATVGPTGCGGTCAFNSCLPLCQSHSSSKQVYLEMYLEAKSSSLLPVPAVHTAFPILMFCFLPEHVKKAAPLASRPRPPFQLL